MPSNNYTQFAVHIELQEVAEFAGGLCITLVLATIAHNKMFTLEMYYKPGRT